MKKSILIVGLILAGILFSGNTKNPAIECRRSVTYTVQSGDTLWEIAAKHAELNTYSKIYMPVFMDGIKEANYDKFQNNRYLQPGDQLVIYYWVK